MNIAVIGKIADMLKKVLDFSKSVIDAADPEKYADSVNKLHQGVSDTYSEMRAVIRESKNFTDEEKLEKLKELANQEAESKRKCEEALQGNTEHVANIALEIVKGFLTLGISFVPEIARRLKLVVDDRVLSLQQTNDTILNIED